MVVIFHSNAAVPVAYCTLMFISHVPLHDFSYKIVLSLSEAWYIAICHLYSVSIQKIICTSYIFIHQNIRKLVLFFTCILLYYMSNENFKEFWINSQFENMRAGFLLWCQNSLRQTTPWNDAFSAMKKKMFYQFYVLALDPIVIRTY